MAKLNVNAGRKLLNELEKDNQEKLWTYLKQTPYTKLTTIQKLAGCTRQSAQRIRDGLIEHGILEEISSYWKTSKKWRAKWALERANQDPEEDEEENEEDNNEDPEDPSPPPPTPKQPVKPKPDPPKGIKEGGVAYMMRQSAEQDVAEEERKTYEDQTGQRPSLPRKRGSIPTRKSMTTRKKPGRK